MKEIKALPHDALRRLKWPVRLTRAGIAAERVTRHFWPVWTTLFAAVAGLAFGLQDVLPVEAVWVTFAVVAIGVAWMLWRGTRGFRWPSREDALERLDRALPGRPIAALQDRQALGADDDGARIVWRAHVARMAEKVGRARAPLPDLRISRLDPLALRYVALTAFITALLFGSIARVGEVRTLAVPGASGAQRIAASWEAWAEPPAYTGLPGLYLNSLDAGSLSLPKGSRVTVRLYGPADSLSLSESISTALDASLDPKAAEGLSGPEVTMRAMEIEALHSGHLAITGEGGREWQIAVQADAPPGVTITGKILRDADGTMSQGFAAQDDYAVTSGRARIELDLGAVDRRFGLAANPEPREALIYDLPLPITGSRTEFTEALVEDASKHPWANLPVQMTFEVTDGSGQTGASKTESLVLPGRRFFDPVAAAVIELRRDLLWSRDNGPRISRILRAVTHRPEGLLRNERAYLMLRVAMRRLDTALAERPMPPDLRDALAEDLWAVAELIEDGGLADALDRMHQAQERLSEAIRNGASPEEIQKLMDDLRQATDDYIRKLAENMERKGADEPNQQADNSQSMTGDQLQQMMDEIQRLMEEGRMAEAQELLDQLSRMMENLRVTEGQPGDGNRGPGQQSMENLRNTLRDQQGLSDDTFRDLQRQFGQQQDGQRGDQSGDPNGTEAAPGQGGQEQPPQGQPGDRSERPGAGNGNRRTDDGNRQGSLAERQNSLREELRRQLGGLPGDPSDERDAARRSLDEAGRAMDGAEQALRRGDTAQAIENQAEAIENLREGMRNLGEALARNQPDQPGSQGQAVGDAGREMPRDPLGRTTGQSGRIGTDENLLQGEDVYRRARDLLDEIRRRSGEQNRPQVELDYLKRLLEEF